MTTAVLLVSSFAPSRRFPGFLGHALSWIDEPTAQDEIRTNEYALLTEVPGDESLPEPQPFAPAAR